MRTNRLPTVVWLTVILTAWGASAPAAEIERCLPDDTLCVLSVNVKQLLHAPLFKKHAAKHFDQLCQHGAARTLLDGLGINPLKDIDRLTAACTGPEDGACVVVCRGRFDTAKFHAALRKAAKEDGKRVKPRKAGEWKCYEVVFGGQGKHGSLMVGSGLKSTGAPVFTWKQTGSLFDRGTAYVALADKNTLVVASSLDGLTAACARAARADKPARGTALRELLDDLDGKQSVCFAVGGRGFSKKPAGEEEQEEAPEQKIDSLSGSITVKDGIEFRCTLTACDTDGAQAAMKVLNDLRTRASGMAAVLAGTQKQYAFLKEVPKAFVATRKGATVLMEGRLSAELLDKLAALGKKAD
jgi:hypothetical protein